MWTPDSWYHDGYVLGRTQGYILRGYAQIRLSDYRRLLPAETDAGICKLLTESNQRRLAATPDISIYPELRGMRELIEAGWRGEKDGAELDDIQAAVSADQYFYCRRHLLGGLALYASPRAQCSCVYFHNSDCGALLGTNLDTTPIEPFGPPVWPLLNEHLIIRGVSSGMFLDEESPEIFPVPIMKLVGRYCRCTDEAVDMLNRYNYFWGPGNHLVVDRKGHVAMIEKSACRIGIRIARDGFGLVTAMTAEHPEMHAYLTDRRAASLKARGLSEPCADTCYWELQDRRRTIMNRLLAEARQSPTFESLRALMQYRGPDGMVCDNGETILPGGPPIEYTLKTQIFCLSEGRAAWWARDNERAIPSWERRMPDVQFNNVLLWP